MIDIWFDFLLHILHYILPFSSNMTHGCFYPASEDVQKERVLVHSLIIRGGFCIDIFVVLYGLVSQSLYILNFSAFFASQLYG